jgi:hypothetical protein
MEATRRQVLQRNLQQNGVEQAVCLRLNVERGRHLKLEVLLKLLLLVCGGAIVIRGAYQPSAVSIEANHKYQHVSSRLPKDVMYDKVHGSTRGERRSRDGGIGLQKYGLKKSERQLKARERRSVRTSVPWLKWTAARP